MSVGLHGVAEIVGERGDQIVVLTKKCMLCHKQVKLTLDRQRFWSWQQGTFVQDAFPEMSAGERELLLTGIDDSCFKKLFKEEE